LPFASRSRAPEPCASRPSSLLSSTLASTCIAPTPHGATITPSSARRVSRPSSTATSTRCLAPATLSSALLGAPGACCCHVQKGLCLMDGKHVLCKTCSLLVWRRGSASCCAALWCRTAKVFAVVEHCPCRSAHCHCLALRLPHACGGDGLTEECIGALVRGHATLGNRLWVSISMACSRTSARPRRAPSSSSTRTCLLACLIACHSCTMGRRALGDMCHV